MDAAELRLERSRSRSTSRWSLDDDELGSDMVTSACRKLCA
jgi:hypothetical protein